MLVMINMKEVLRMIKPMDLASLLKQMAKCTKDNGKMINHMVLVCRHYQVKINTMVNSKTALNVDMELTFGQTNHIIKGAGKTMYLMVKVNTFGMMVENIKDSSN